jgi:hypothetical protein
MIGSILRREQRAVLERHRAGKKRQRETDKQREKE